MTDSPSDAFDRIVVGLREVALVGEGRSVTLFDGTNDSFRRTRLSCPPLEDDPETFAYRLSLIAVGARSSASD